MVFIRYPMRINTNFNARNVVMKWGIYRWLTECVTLNKADVRPGPFNARSIKGRYERISRSYDELPYFILLRNGPQRDSRPIAQKSLSLSAKPK